MLAFNFIDILRSKFALISAKSEIALAAAGFEKQKNAKNVSNKNNFKIE